MLISLILISQFNSVVKPAIIMTGVLMSTIGALIGLMVFQMPFSVVMGGIGIISLAGIVVKNGIILIDYVDILREHDLLDDEELDRMRREVADEVGEAIREAAAAPTPDPDELYENVYGDEDWREQFAAMNTAAPFGERQETRSWQR